MVHVERDRILGLLRGLAKYQDDGAPVISLYLDTWWDEGRKRDAARVFVKSKLQQALAGYAGSGPGRESLARDAARIRKDVDELIAPTSLHRGHGFALFACDSRGLREVVAAPQPFENLLVVRQVPYLIPLARLVDDYQTAFLCQVDSRSARIREFVFGGLAAQASIDHPDVPGRHHQGGWAQMRYQRRIDWAREQHVREVADAFVKLADDNKGARLLLSGPPEALGSLRAALPKRVLARRPAELGIDRSAELPDVLRTVLEQIDALERDEECGRVRDTLDAALAGHLAAVGPEDVVLAVNRSAVAVLLLHRGLKLSGWRCGSGCVLGVDSAQKRCPVCSAEISACDLAERLVESVLASGGEVDLVHASTELSRVGGVAASLRFAV